MSIFNCLTFVRKIHSGHVKRVLNSKRAPFHRRFDKILADQRERPNFLLKNIKYEKENLARELSLAKNELVGLFSLEEASQMLDSKPEKTKSDNTIVNEARRIYRMLRPDAPSFFEEQGSIYLKTSMDKLLSSNKEDSKEIVPISEADVIHDEDPVFTSSCYTLSVISLLESLTEDIYSFCEYLEIEDLPEKSYNSIGKLFDKLENYFKLKIDGSNSEEWIGRVWPKFKNLFIDELKEITDSEIYEWLKLHLNRVSTNLKTLDRPNKEWYNFSEDILYDSFPFSEQVSIENKIGFPLDNAPKYLTSLLSLFEGIKVDNVEDLIVSLKGLGLSNWFRLLPNEIETSLFGVQKNYEKFEFTKDDFNLSYLLIETMSRNMDHLLDIQTYSPDSILSNISKNLKNNLFEMPENTWLASDYIKEMITKVYSKKSNSEDLNDFIDTPLKQMLTNEYNYNNRVGAIIFSNKDNNGDDKKGENDWKWVVPSVDSIFDVNRNMYIRNKSNLDPLIRLDNLKSFILSRRRMRSMTKEGRVYFVRVVVAIGDGNGYFGIGIGYGNDINSAKNNGIENGLKNMFFLDYDPFESFKTPVLGREYGSRCLIEGRPMSSGIRCNTKFLPLVYLMGLNNVRFKLKGTTSWVTRIKSVRKALESIMSRKTICNMLGKKYIDVSSPGDYTIHWSDEWFTPMLEEYRDKIKKLKKLRFKFSKRNRFKHNILLPSDIKDYVPSYSRSKVNTKTNKTNNILDKLNDIKGNKTF